jgi:hypothetical protein
VATLMHACTALTSFHFFFVSSEKPDWGPCGCQVCLRSAEYATGIRNSDHDGGDIIPFPPSVASRVVNCRKQRFWESFTSNGEEIFFKPVSSSPKRAGLGTDP